MPNFSAEPPKDSQRSAYRLIRTPPTSPITGHIISDHLVGCPTHFAGNRTVPCERPKCELCMSGIGWRWHGYFLALISTTHEIVIYEITAITSDPFTEFHGHHGTLRNAAFKCARVNGKPNGRVLAQLKPGDPSRLMLPDDQPLEPLLCHIWNIPPNQLEERDEMSRPPHADVAVDRDKPETIPLGSRPTEDQRTFVQRITRKRGGNGRITHADSPGTYPIEPNGV